MLPDETWQLFRSKFGKSLLIIGRPGTGKTIFVFDILHEPCAGANCLYVSLHVCYSESRLLTGCPRVGLMPIK